MPRHGEPGVSSTLAEGIAALHDEAGGMLTLDVILHTDVPRLAAAALDGCQDTARLLIALGSALRQIGAAPANSPAECGCCGAALRPGRFAIVIARPNICDPVHGLGTAICTRCGPTRGAVRAAGVRAVKLIWPNARPVTIHGAAGHA
jgi:hypothetical protein